MKINPTHEITEWRSLISITVRCSCGWSRAISRRQNALACAAKVRSAKLQHEKQIKAEAAS